MGQGRSIKKLSRSQGQIQNSRLFSHLGHVGLGTLERLALLGQVDLAVVVGHLAAGGVGAEVGVVAHAAPQVQAEVVGLAGSDGLRDVHDPGRVCELEIPGGGFVPGMVGNGRKSLRAFLR